MDRIVPNLYIGDLSCSRQPERLRAAGIDRVINVTAEHPPLGGERERTLVVPVLDQTHARLLECFEQTTRFIDAGMAAGTATLVHCQLGISRSATVVLAYLMTHHRWRLSQAWEHLRARRPQVEPNAGFLSQLRAHEHRLFGNVTSLAQLTLMDAQSIDPGVDDRDPVVALQAVADRCTLTLPAASRAEAIEACVAHLRLVTSEALLAALPRAASRIWQTHGGQGPAAHASRVTFAEVWRQLAGLAHPPPAAIGRALAEMVAGDSWQEMLMDVPLAAGFVQDLRVGLGLAP